MTAIDIRAGGGYRVYVGSGLLGRCGELIVQAVEPCRCAVITDSSVGPLYLDTALKSLGGAGFEPVGFEFPAGEKSKNLTTLADILEFTASSGLTRGDCVAALGGGVTGDMAGFAAGCYMRGIRYVQLPTTLLASVDSSVGGKTAVDLKAGKNLAGLFIQPKAVICDTNTLLTLSPEIFADGAAEAVKTGILFDEALFSTFERGSARDAAEDVICRCVRCKGRVVEADEFERGERRLLNLGHTVGHAIEKCSGYSVSHGKAVAIGTAVIARAADRLGMSDEPLGKRIANTLERNSLPTATEFSAAELARAALSDKKRIGKSITVILPRRIGDCFQKEIPVDELEALISAGLN